MVKRKKRRPAKRRGRERGGGKRRMCWYPMGVLGCRVYQPRFTELDEVELRVRYKVAHEFEIRIRSTRDRLDSPSSGFLCICVA